MSRFDADRVVAGMADFYVFGDSAFFDLPCDPVRPLIFALEPEARIPATRLTSKLKASVFAPNTARPEVLDFSFVCCASRHGRRTLSRIPRAIHFIINGGTEFPSRSHLWPYVPIRIASSGNEHSRLTSRIENFRFSVGCMPAAMPAWSPPCAVMVGHGRFASGRFRLKYFSDSPPGFSLSYSSPIL